MIIEARDLAKTYHSDEGVVHALNGLSLSIKTGDFVAVRGVSGCGKSTLLHILGLLAEADSGTYRFCGADVHGCSEEERAAIRNRMIGFVFQQFHLLPRASVLDNVALPAVYRQGRPDTRRARQCLEAVGIADLAKRRSNQLSGGQQQRVAIARALMHEPVLLLADEPTGNLDSASADSVLEALENLHRHGTTLLMVTHEPAVAARAKRQVVLRDGRILADSDKPEPNAAPEARPPPLSLAAQEGPPWPRLFRTHLQQAWNSLRTHLPRAALSAIGILVGTFSVMMTFLLLAGARESIRLQMEALGTNLMIVSPQIDRTDDRPARRLTLEDAQAATAVPGVRAVAGIVMGQAELAIEGGAKRTTPLVGAEASFANFTANQPGAGRFFSIEEVERHARVALLGATPAHALFGAANPVGQTLAINGLVFRIIGLMPERGANPWRDTDDIAVIPVTTAMKPVLGRQDLDQLQLEIGRPDQMDTAEQALRAVLSRRNLDPASGGDAFRFRNMSRLRQTFEDITAILSGLLMSVSVISLLVGGIGIMNIMLVAVTERTREVGLRKALGARVKDILAQFLAEAVLLSLAGGAAGVALGFAALRWKGGLGVPFAWTWTAAAASFAAAGWTGIGFGLWPAWRAARREPVEALRHE
jgi:macrolide transport system ATP-binding/permease protein